MIEGVELTLRDDISALAPLEPTRKQLLNLREACYSAITVQIKHLVYGCEFDSRTGAGRLVSEWQQVCLCV